MDVSIEMVQQISLPVADRSAKPDESRSGPGQPVALHRALGEAEQFRHLAASK
jgi:hypothetical protein